MFFFQNMAGMAVWGMRAVSVILIFAILKHTTAIEEVVFTHAPDSVKFLTSEPIRSSYLADIFSAMYPLSIRSNVEWRSLATVTPWKTLEAIAVIEILGFDNEIDLPLTGTKFLLENVGDLNNQYDLPAYRIQQRYHSTLNPILLNMDLSKEFYELKRYEPLYLKDIPADPKERLQLALNDKEIGDLFKKMVFNISHPSDVKLLTELATLKEVLKALTYYRFYVHDGVPDLYWFKISGLENILSLYSADSFKFQEALRLIRQMITDVEQTMRDLYDDNVVIAVIKTNSMPLSLTRKVRNLLESTEAPTPVPETDLNLAQKYDPIYPVIFTILLFVGISLTLTVLAISIALWNMDPGRDSIIYRMTSQRMKRD